MAAEDILAEALARIEFKMDMILAHIGFMTHMPRMDPNGHDCPTCRQRATYQVNLLKGVVERKCGCSTGKFISSFAFTLTPVDITGKKDDSSNNADVSNPGTENSSNANRRKGG